MNSLTELDRHAGGVCVGVCVCLSSRVTHLTGMIYPPCCVVAAERADLSLMT